MYVHKVGNEGGGADSGNNDLLVAVNLIQRKCIGLNTTGNSDAKRVMTEFVSKEK